MQRALTERNIQYTREMILSRISDNQISRVSAGRLKFTSDQIPAFSPNMSVMKNQPLIKEMSTEELLKKGLRKQNPHKKFFDKSALYDYRFIDEASEKIATSPGLTNWAKRQNLKTAASIYAAIDDLDQEIAKKKEVLNQTKISIKKLSNQIKQISEVIKYVEQYQAYKPVHEKYLKVKNQEAFFQKHEAELLLFDGAQAMLKKAGLNPDKVSPVDLRKRLGSWNRLKKRPFRTGIRFRKNSKHYRKIIKICIDILRRIRSLAASLMPSCPRIELREGFPSRNSLDQKLLLISFKHTIFSSVPGK